MVSSAIHPILYGVYTLGVAGPQAIFKRLEDAHDWGEFKYSDRYEVLTCYARWTLEDEKMELEELYGNTAK